MKKDMDGPADTRMMGIVHDALRRDLARARAALAGPVAPEQRRALAAHVGWMMDFLHEHHRGEDAGLYPISCFAVFVDQVPAAAQAARTAPVSCGVACSGHGPRNLAAMMTRRSLMAMSS